MKPARVKKSEISQSNFPIAKSALLAKISARLHRLLTCLGVLVCVLIFSGCSGTITIPDRFFIFDKDNGIPIENVGTDLPSGPDGTDMPDVPDVLSDRTSQEIFTELGTTATDTKIPLASFNSLIPILDSLMNAGNYQNPVFERIEHDGTSFKNQQPWMLEGDVAWNKVRTTQCAQENDPVCVYFHLRHTPPTGESKDIYFPAFVSNGLLATPIKDYLDVNTGKRRYSQAVPFPFGFYSVISKIANIPANDVETDDLDLPFTLGVLTPLVEEGIPQATRRYIGTLSIPSQNPPKNIDQLTEPFGTNLALSSSTALLKDGVTSVIRFYMDLNIQKAASSTPVIKLEELKIYLPIFSADTQSVSINTTEENRGAHDIFLSNIDLTVENSEGYPFKIDISQETVDKNRMVTGRISAKFYGPQLNGIGGTFYFVEKYPNAPGAPVYYHWGGLGLAHTDGWK